MSKFEQGAYVALSTGTKYISLYDETLNPSSVFLTVLTDTSDLSCGYWDSTEQFSGNRTFSETTTSKSIVHYRTIGGVKTKVLSATVTSVSTGEIVINIDTLSSSITIGLLVKGS